MSSGLIRKGHKMRMIINDLDNWIKWEKPLWLIGMGARTVEVHVNCTKETVLYVVHEGKTKEPVLAGVVQAGQTEVRLNVQGEVYLMHETEGEVYYYDPSGRNVRRSAPTQVSFTGPLNRVTRDPEMERMMRLMESRMINQQRQRDAVIERQLAQMAAGKAAGSVVDQETGEVVENGKDDHGATGSTAAETDRDADGGGTGSGEAATAAGAGEGKGSEAAPPSGAT